MNKMAFIDDVRDYLDGKYTKKEIKEIYQAIEDRFFNFVRESAVGDTLTLFDGVKFVLIEHNSRNAVNPSTGEKIVVPAKIVLKVRCGTKVKEALG